MLDIKGYPANIVTIDQVTPLHEACLSGHIACVRALLSSGANVSMYFISACGHGYKRGCKFGVLFWVLHWVFVSGFFHLGTNLSESCLVMTHLV